MTKGSFRRCYLASVKIAMHGNSPHMFKRIKSELSPSFMLANIDGANLTSPEVSLTITFFDKTKHTRIETFEGTTTKIKVHI